MKKNCVTAKQAFELEKLGFKEKTRFLVYCGKNLDNIKVARLPTVDETIDWLRRKYHIIIYNHCEPFVDPANKKVYFNYRVKKCNKEWNWRIYIGTTKLSSNPYAVKRMAIRMAINFLKNEAAVHKNRKKIRKIQSCANRR